MQTVYVFGVDGVLCDICKPIDDQVLQQLAILLNSGAYVAVNTGRAMDRVGSELVDRLRPLVVDIALTRFFVSTEMGGITTTFHNGKEVTTRTRFSLDPSLISKAHRIFRKNSYDTMYEYHKETMATFVKYLKAPNEKFIEQQAALVTAIKTDLRGDFVVHTTVESIDVHASDAGKQAGAEVIYEWLQQVSDLTHDNFTCFGDSHSDYEMARWFAQQGCQTRFIFTGSSLQVDRHSDVDVIDTANLYTAGTLEFFNR